MIGMEWKQSGLLSAAASASLVTTLLLLAIMTLGIRRRNKKQGAYKLMMIGLTLALIPSLSMVLSGGAGSLPPIASGTLWIFAMIIINFAVLELYTPRKKRDKLFFAAALAGAALAAAFEWNGGRLDLTPGNEAEQSILLLPSALYWLLLHLLFAAVIFPRVRQRWKYALVLICSAAAQLLAIAVDGAPWTAGASMTVLSVQCAFLLLIVFERQLERMQTVYSSSIRDGLTGLFNRRQFLKVTNRYLSKGLPVAVIFCDLDNFKKLNDTRGHAFADGVLRQAAGIIQDEVNGIGAAGRYGGEELVASVARPGVRPQEIAEAIRRRIEEETPVTVSVGWSPVAEGQSVEIAMKLADEAMYVSKTTGKNKVTASKPSLQV